ncbi:hypothetical protein F0919_07915 [Taibaiella lutea]|uniref:Uncharacterized protein n=1 Tax=Taibaiella lutea TaxID=2608001 RepID=A0A5M6CHL2_9BACT|nr:hypothetical protein [Taibaiella lutea]KAA5534537.1 hypothetical protein F0919_07915 [Taibaiella lutea]
MQKNAKNAPDKKVLSLEIKNQLNQSLGHLKELWGEKKFNNKIDEAVKLFTKGFKKPEQPKKESVKKEKKVTVKPMMVTEKKTVKKDEVTKEKEAVAEAIPAPKKQSPQKTVKKSAVKSAK